MAKDKNNAPQELTDEELVQVTGGTTWITESQYDSMVAICNQRSEEGCEDGMCRWAKMDKQCTLARGYTVIAEPSN